MKVREVMSKPPVTVREDAALETAARLMLDQRIGSVLVVDGEGRVVGIVTESDFAAKTGGVPFSLFTAPQVLGEWIGKEGIERVYERARSRPVSDFMSSPVVAMQEEGSVEDAVRLMLEHDVNRVAVLAGERPVGVLARHDLLRMLARNP